MENIFGSYADIITKLLLALLMGGLIGIERTRAGKQAGMRTYALVSMGSSLFVIVSEMARALVGPNPAYDPTRIASQIVVGIGFIGAGLIIFQGNNIQGLTTAAGLWVAAGLGMAIGFGFYGLALIAALLTLFIFTVLWRVEQFIMPEVVSDIDLLKK